MKKFFLLLAIISTITQAQAFEDYIIVGDKKFDFIKSQNNDIVSVEPFYTIDNTKNVVERPLIFIFSGGQYGKVCYQNHSNRR